MTTVARLRHYLDQVPAGEPYSTQLSSILAAAESIVVAALGFTFFDVGTSWDDVAVSSKRVQSEPSVYLKLPPYLAGSITSIYPLSGLRVGTVGLTADVDYEEQDRQYLYRPGGWGALRYAVTAKWGYGPPPEAIVHLLCELAVNVWRSRDQGSFQTSAGVDTLNNSTGGGFIKYVGGLNADQRRVITLTRRQYIEAIH
jgi:hypothetical protein